jgi:Xaa-Pro aminopeptidase
MIPVSELRRRVLVLQIKLQAQGLDGVLLAHNISMYYFAGTIQCQYIYIPASGDACGLVRKNMERAKRESGINLLPMGGFSALPGLLATAGFSPKRLGLELDVLPTATYFRLAKVFSGAEMVDCTTAVREARQVKSEYELGLLDEAARQVDTFHKEVPALLYEGKSELELAAECEAILRKLGHQGSARMRGFNQEMFYGHLLSGKEGAISSFLDSPTGGVGLSPAAPQGAGKKAIRVGEPITVDYGGIFEGYIVDQTRMYSIGILPDVLSRAYEASLSVQEKVVSLLRPGITGGEIFAAAVNAAENAGLLPHFMGFGDTQAKYVGHGVGLEFDEFPILAKGSPHVLEENMVVAVEPKFTFPDVGVVGIENTWHILKNGTRKISLTPDDHITV